MSNLQIVHTVEELEALKEGITPGPWEWLVGEKVAYRHELVGKNGAPVLACGALRCPDEPDEILISAAPALLDQLIAEKKAHQKLRKRIEERIWELKQPLCSYMPDGDDLDDYLEQWGWQSYEAEILTNILEGA